VHQLFIDLKKACDSVKGEVLYVQHPAWIWYT
jgi:hypothetical protein